MNVVGVKESRIRLGRGEGNISDERLSRDKGIGVCVRVLWVAV